MATTNIELDIENITGVADADDQFIKTAQKFVVASIPKDLMLWAGTSTAVGSHGGDSSPTAITLPQPTDSIIDVQRNGFSAEQVPESMQGFIANSSSLHLATETFPKYYLQAGNKVIVKPNPSDSETALVNYVDFLKVDDDCDLRSAVIFHAASKEFEQLASAQSTGVLTSLTAVNAEIDECLTIADNIHTEVAIINSSADSALTEIGLANAEVDKMATEVGLDNAELDLAKAELAEAATLVDSSIDTATAAIATAAGRVNTAVLVANGQFDQAVLESAQAEAEADDGAIATALGAINTNVDSAVTSLGSCTTAIGAANTEAAELATQTDNSGDFETALDAINTAVDHFRGTSDPALFGDEDAYLSGVGITRVKAALDKAIALIDGNSPDSNTDYDAYIVEEDSEMASVVLQAVQSQVGIANAQLQEWAATVQALQAEIAGFASEVSSRAGFSGAKSQSIQGYINVASAHATTAQAYIGAAQGFAAEVQAFQASVGIFSATAQNRVNVGNAFIAEANASAQEAQTYAAEVSSRIAQVQAQVGVAQGYIANGAGYSRVADGYAKIAQGYLGTAGAYLQSAQSYVASAQAYANEIQSKINIAQGYSSEVQSRLAHKAGHSQSADRYYKMAHQEVAVYTQNNSKMISRSMMAQAASQQG